MNTAEALARNAQRFPEKFAIVDERRKLTHREFHLRSNRLGNYLLEQGVKKGDRVAISCRNRAEHLESIFALAKIGAVSVPFDYGWSVQEYDAMIKFFEPSAFLIEMRRETEKHPGPRPASIGCHRLLAIAAQEMQPRPSYEEAISASARIDPRVDSMGSFPHHDHLGNHRFSQGLCH